MVLAQQARDSYHSKLYFEKIRHSFVLSGVSYIVNTSYPLAEFKSPLGIFDNQVKKVR